MRIHQICMFFTGDTFTPVSKQYDYYNNVTVTYLGEGVHETYTDGTYEVRKRIYNNLLYIDATLTPTGFSGVKDTDWEVRTIYIGQSNTFRFGVRDGNFVIDCEITAIGFGGTEGIDWENIAMTNGGGSLLYFRDGIRNSAYVIDKALTGTGFTGTENTDWENLETHS